LIFQKTGKEAKDGAKFSHQALQTLYDLYEINNPKSAKKAKETSTRLLSQKKLKKG
jgi:hypothetical protein